MAQAVASHANAAQGGKYLTFCVANEEYGLEILKVREIIGLMSITPVPRAPQDVRGVINLRGKIVPVVDLRGRFCMPTADDTDLSCVIVVDVRSQEQSCDIGVVVDSVSEVLDIAGDQIEPAPTFGNSVNTSYILGIAKSKGRVTVLLDVEEVLTSFGSASGDTSSASVTGLAGL